MIYDLLLCTTSAHKKEMKDIAKLLDLLYLKGAIVTLDAMGCQKIWDEDADYILALRRGSLWEDVAVCFRTEIW